MKFIKTLFKGRKQQCNIPDVTHRFSTLEVHDQLLIDKVIELLKFNSEDFSARWFSGERLDASVQSNDRKILIMIETGEITSPTTPKMTNQQKEIVKQLVAPIVEKDSKYLIDNLLNGG